MGLDPTMVKVPRTAGVLWDSRKPQVVIQLLLITKAQQSSSLYHWEICKNYNIEVTDKYYEHKPTTETENKEATILWDMPIQTDKEIKANRPDIVVKNKKERTCQLIDMSVPIERNTSLKVTEKLSKYKDLEIEIERMWGLNTMTIPVVVGALGLIKKGMEKYISTIPGNIKIQELQSVSSSELLIS